MYTNIIQGTLYKFSRDILDVILLITAIDMNFCVLVNALIVFSFFFGCLQRYLHFSLFGFIWVDRTEHCIVSMKPILYGFLSFQRLRLLFYVLYFSQIIVYYSNLVNIILPTIAFVLHH